MSEYEEPPTSVGSELITAGATLMEVNTRQMRAISIQAPRDLEKVLSDIVAEIDMVQAWAEHGFYSFPKGGSIISGPSVNLTRIVARNFGNCAVRSYLYGVNGGDGFETYQLCGVFFDLQKNYSIERMYTVSPQKWRNKGYVTIQGEELMQELMIGASKAERNAVTAAVPDWIMHSVFERCRKVAAQSTRSEMSSIIEWFMQQGVSRDALERAVGANLDRLDEKQLGDLRGIKNALRDREITAASIGGDSPVAEAAAAAAAEAADTDTATLDGVLAGGADVTSGREKTSREKTVGDLRDGPEQGDLLKSDERDVEETPDSAAEVETNVVPIKGERPDAGF